MANATAEPKVFVQRLRRDWRKLGLSSVRIDSSLADELQFYFNSTFSDVFDRLEGGSSSISRVERATIRRELRFCCSVFQATIQLLNSSRPLPH